MSGKRILLVEDSPSIAEMVKDELSEAGYEVFWAQNGFEALRDLEDIMPDLIISDIMMPKVDGLELCAAMQNRMETRNIPFIIFSSHFDEDTVKRGRAIGAKFFIAKPFKMETLLAAVKKIFSPA
jgi:twitching motility two-component system response regulator PilG